MKKLLLGGLSAAIFALGVMTVLPVQPPEPPVSAQQASDKYDGDCTGRETQGRCADKCPPNTDKGAYFLRGYDDNGAAICAFSWYNACPYVEAVPADDPMCEKARQDQVRAGVLPPDGEVWGK